MRTMSARHLPALLVTTVALLVSAAPASAGVYSYKSLSGRHPFVTVQTSGGRTFLHVTAATRKRYASRMLEWSCFATNPGDHLLWFPSAGGGDTFIRQPDPIRVARDADYCQIQVVVRKVRHSRRDGRRVTTTRTRKLRQTVAVTAEGQAYVDRVRGAEGLLFGAIIASTAFYDAGKQFPSAEEIVATYPVPSLVALDGPDGAAPLRKIGLWTSGARLRVTYGLPDGTQLFADQDLQTNVLTTNAEGVLNELRGGDGWWEDSERFSESSRG